MNLHRLKELGILNGDIRIPEGLVPAVPVENTIEERPYRFTVNVGDWVWYKGNEYVIIDYWFDCGGNAKIINMVRINKGDSRGPFVMVKSLADEKIDECELVRRGVVV